MTQKDEMTCLKCWNVGTQAWFCVLHRPEWEVLGSGWADGFDNLFHSLSLNFCI